MEMHTMIRKETSVLMMLVTGFAVTLLLFFAKMLYDMTSYVGEMATHVEVMSHEVVSLNKKFDYMNDNMIHIRKSMNEMNSHIHLIQSEMAKDISSISGSVETMSSDMSDMNNNMKKFSSPKGFMRSFRF
jgi:hypothetical protein